MATAIQTNQVDNRVLTTDDPDYIPPGEKSGDELELEAQQRALEDQQQEQQGEQQRRERREPPLYKVEREAERLREQRDRLRSEKESAEREREKLREELARYRMRHELESEAQERVAKMQREAQRPDPETDPYGAQLFDMQQEILAQKKLREQLEEQQRQQQTYYQAQQQQQQFLQEIDGYLRSDVSRYKNEHPEFNYDDAAKYVHQKYIDFWQSTGLTEPEAQAVTANTFLAIGRSAQVRGQSAASSIAYLAALTGYKNVPGAAPNGQSAQERIARLDRGQKLQGIGGKTPSERTVAENIGLLSAQQMAEMSDDDYLRMKQDPQQARLLERRLEELG